MDLPLEDIVIKSNVEAVESGLPIKRQGERKGHPQYARRRSGTEDAEPLLRSHPEPTDDPLDPLNFSRLEKWTSLGIVMYL